MYQRYTGLHMGGGEVGGDCENANRKRSVWPVYTDVGEHGDRKLEGKAGHRLHGIEGFGSIF